jgi:hypothetical protein
MFMYVHVDVDEHLDVDEHEHVGYRRTEHVDVEEHQYVDVGEPRILTVDVNELKHLHGDEHH